MRNAFVKQIILEMEKDKNIFFLTADLGFNALEQIQEKFKGRFINVGIAEQNMMGIAAGLALSGKKVIAYSIASFSTLRCYEQIKIDICYHNLPVKIIGTGGGFNYSTHGTTHHTTEDIAIMTTLPNMKVLSPGYSWEVTEATKEMMKDNGPAYIKLGKDPKINPQKPNWKFLFGKVFQIKEGKDVVIITTSNILESVLKSADILENKTGKKIGVISAPSIKPLDEKSILKIASETKNLFVVEEHNIIGGLGSIISTILAQKNSVPVNFKIMGINDKFISEVGDREYLLKVAGLSPEKIATEIINKIKQ